MIRTWRDAGNGFVIGVAVALAAGALWGAVFGIQLYIDDGRPYHRYTGADGAYGGALMGLVFGGLPAGVVGAIVGVLVGRRREREVAAPTAGHGDRPEEAAPEALRGRDGRVDNALLADASVRKVDTKRMSEKTLRNAFTRNDGQPPGDDW